MPKHVLVFAAHGDDMEFFAGGTIAKFCALGHEVSLVCATDNDKGSFELDAKELREVRDAELHGAARILGLKRVMALGYSDGDLAYDVPMKKLRGQFMRAIRELRPDIIMSFDPFTPYEGHPDHRFVAQAANEAASFAHMPNFYPEQHDDEGLALHCVGEQWYFAKAPRDQNKFVDTTDYLDKKVDALCAHTAQMVLTVQDMQHHLASAPFDIPSLRQQDPHDYRAVIDRQMRAAGEAVARRSGLDCKYAEGFRRTRYGGLESMAKDQPIAEDV